MSHGSLPRLTETRINHYFSLAKNACFYSDNKKARVGCVVVFKNRVIGVGWNQNKTSPTQKHYNSYRGYDTDASNAYNTLHAECHALSKVRDLDIEWGKAHVFVYRIKKDGSSGLARPCSGCQVLIRNMGIKNIYYSTENGWGYERIN